MFPDLNAALVTRFHDQNLLRQDMGPPPRTGEVWRWIALNHQYNGKLWREEDRARRVDVPADDIARSKRLIDGYNQARNDAVEAIDEQLFEALRHNPTDVDARLSSETPGSMIDRLSILSLKIYHMELQTRRDEVEQEHRDTCEARLRRLLEQRHDLGQCLDELLQDLVVGRARFKVYRQFKMYNDPRLNPCLYGQGPGRPREGASHERHPR